MITTPPPLPPGPEALLALRDQWSAAWPAALEAWSRFTRLRPPALCLTDQEAQDAGLTGSFAMIRLLDQAVYVSLPQVVASRVEPFALQVLAHEIGHHILAPGTLTDHARCIARMRPSLPTLEAQAPMVANLYTDLLINDRLQRSAGIFESEVYHALNVRGEGGAVWTLYMRIYEILWSLERGSLGGGSGAVNDELEGDAWLGARLVRAYARDWLDGCGRFAALLLPHLLEDKKSADMLAPLLDTKQAGAGGQPGGLTEVDAGERAGAIHPAHDPELSGVPLSDVPGEPAPPADKPAQQPSGGQGREPFEYGEILRASGVSLTDHEVAVRYYRERALPHLIPFLSRELPRGSEPLPEGLEAWDIGHPLEAADWLGTVMQSPRVIPGMTTVQRVYGTVDGQEPRREPLDLDIYVDSSGSMTNPQRQISYPALAGTILCLSALRAGARVQVTLWSGKNQFQSTPGFVRDETAALRVLTGFIGGATAFPLHILRDTYQARKPHDRPVHILNISDDGASTMFDTPDEKATPGWDVSNQALTRARGGGTLVLNLFAEWETHAVKHAARYPALGWLLRARDEAGWNVFRVAAWDNLVEFARQFSRKHYGPAPKGKGRRASVSTPA